MHSATTADHHAGPVQGSKGPRAEKDLGAPLPVENLVNGASCSWPSLKEIEGSNSVETWRNHAETQNLNS